MLRLLIDIWRLLDQQQRRRLLLLQVSLVVMSLSTILSIVAIMPFLAVLAEPSLIETNRWLSMAYSASGASDPQSFTVILGVALVVAILAANAINLLGTLLLSRFAFWVGISFQFSLFREYLYKEYSFHTRINNSELINNTTTEVQRVMHGLLQSSMLMISNAITTFSIAVTLVLVNPLGAMLAASTLGGAYAILYIWVRKRLQSNGETHSLLSRHQHKVLTEGLAGVKDITILGVRSYFTSEFSKSGWSMAKVQSSSYALAVCPKYILESIAFCGLVVAGLVLGGQGASTGAFLGQLSFVGLAAYRLLPALQGIYQSAATMRSNRSAFTKIHADLRSSIANSRHIVHTPTPTAAVADWPKHAIELRGVTFHYRPDLPSTITNLNLSIHVGDSIALVGASGSGKTTTADIVLGLLRPSSGQLVVDGEPIVGATMDRWHTVIGYVPQHIFLADCSIAENIALGIPRDAIDMHQILHVCRLACLDSFVASLPDGYDTRVGDKGVRLSGGQRQRIGIARALYRNATVLVFDEATSALDGLTEQEVMESIRSLHGQRTIIIIAHRLSTIRHCDRIFELEHGRVVHQGTFDELLTISPRFNKLATASEMVAPQAGDSGD